MILVADPVPLSAETVCVVLSFLDERKVTKENQGRNKNYLKCSPRGAKILNVELTLRMAFTVKVVFSKSRKRSAFLNGNFYNARPVIVGEPNDGGSYLDFPCTQYSIRAIQRFQKILVIFKVLKGLIWL